MKGLLEWGMTVIFWLLVLQGLAITSLFRKLVRLQYGSHRQSWEQDGKPTGSFFYPPETRRWGGWMVRWSSWQASYNRFWAWLLATPGWMTEDRRALRLLFWMRALMLGWLALFFGVIGFLIAVSELSHGLAEDRSQAVPIYLRESERAGLSLDSVGAPAR